MKQDIVELIYLGIGEFTAKWGNSPDEMIMSSYTYSQFKKNVIASFRTPGLYASDIPFVPMIFGSTYEYFNGLKIIISEAIKNNYIALGSRTIWNLYTVQIAEDSNLIHNLDGTEGIKPKRMLRPYGTI